MWAISPSQMIFATQSPLLKQNLEYRERGNCRWKEVSTNEKHLQMGYHYFPVVQLKNIGHMGLLADMPVYIIISIQWCSEDKGQPSTVTIVPAKCIQSKLIIISQLKSHIGLLADMPIYIIFSDYYVIAPINSTDKPIDSAKYIKAKLV